MADDLRVVASFFLDLAQSGRPQVFLSVGLALGQADLAAVAPPAHKRDLAGRLAVTQQDSSGGEDGLGFPVAPQSISP